MGKMLTENWLAKKKKKMTTYIKRCWGDPTFRGSFSILNFYSDFQISSQTEDALTASSGVFRRQFTHKGINFSWKSEQSMNGG